MLGVCVEINSNEAAAAQSKTTLTNLVSYLCCVSGVPTTGSNGERQ